MYKKITSGLATFIGVGGIWNEGMDVSSFAGQS